MENKLYTTILIKRRISGDPGPPEALEHGELAFNEASNPLPNNTTNNETLSGN